MEQQTDFSLVEAYFHLSPNKPHAPIIEMPATDFLHDEKVALVLDTYGKTADATDRTLPASFIGMTFCNLCVTQLIYAVQFNQLLDLSLENLTFYIESKEAHYAIGYTINEIKWIDIPEHNRETFLLQSWTAFIKEHIRPAIESIAHATNVKPTMIWSQFGGQLSRMKDIFVEDDNHMALERLRQDYIVMTEVLSADVFGLRKNPFKHKPQYVENPYNENEQWMIRSSCCMWDRRENGEKCYVCPRLTAAQRNEMKEKIQNN